MPRAQRPDRITNPPEQSADRSSEESRSARRGISGTPTTAASLASGIAVIRDQLRLLPRQPGVYRMVDERGEILYVGKARSLKNRVATYTRPDGLTVRLRRMVAATRKLEVITTQTEAEALLLEANLIKRFLPPFNVLLRDDKSFPYILISTDHDWPQLTKHRGAKRREGHYFGPFASASAVNHTLATLERAFLLRSCNDTVFASRKRPCLLYQVKRCAAPCVDRIDQGDYAVLVREARDFLQGRNQDIQQRLAARMQAASDAQNFEEAAVYRDRIRALSQIQARQTINVPGLDDADVIAAHSAGGQACVQVFFFRGGHNYGNRAYYPSHTKDVDLTEVLGAFIGQFYAARPAPRLVLLSHQVENQSVIADALSLKMERRVRIRAPKAGAFRKPVTHALKNARDALARRLSESASQRRLLEGVAEVFGLDGPPTRIEVYDNSHVQGTHAVGAMIVAGPDGFLKNAYRKFNIKTAGKRGEPNAPGRITPGDDYGMMREVLTRRFSRAQKEDPDRTRGQWPDLVLIDGGKGQLNVAEEVLDELGIDDVPLVAIAKGPERDAGRESFHRPGRAPVSLPERDPVLYFLQRLRDEAHRFAIGAHRGKRSSAIGRSLLDEVPGIGPRRKRALLHHFGSARNVANAGLVDLEAAEGISKSVAQKIYDHFHSEA